MLWYYMMQLYSVGIKHNNHLAFKYEVKKEITSTYILLHEVFSYEWMWSMVCFWTYGWNLASMQRMNIAFSFEKWKS